jgi:SAM-dependent methyltransferase
MTSTDGEPRPAPAPVPPPTSPYWRFYDEVADAQLTEWVPREAQQVLDLSCDGPHRAERLRDLGHQVLRIGSGPVEGVQTVLADARALDWLTTGSFDAVVAESRALSMALATEETARDLSRVLRSGGRLLLVVDSLVTGLARLADQGRWAELADVPSSDVVLVEDEDGTITRCFWPEELEELLQESGFEVEWVRPRSVLTPAAVERALAASGDEALRTLVRTELQLAVGREGESTGLHLVASARKP